MARPPRTEPSLTEWAVLGLLGEKPAHGWDIARAFAPDGDIGQVWTVSRPLVYRAITVLRELGYIVDRGSAPSATGPDRVLLAPTPRGRQALRRWLGRPTGHVRDLRSELMVKLLLLDRAGRDRAPLLQAQLAVLERGEHALVARVGAEQRVRPDHRGLATHDGPCGPCVRRGAARPAHRRSGALRGNRPRQLRSHLARRHAAPTRRRRLRPFADRPHRAAPRLPRRRRRLLPRLGARAPPRVRRVGRDRRSVPRRSAAWDVRDPLAAPAQPDLAVALHAARGSRPTASSSQASTSSTVRPSSI